MGKEMYLFLFRRALACSEMQKTRPRLEPNSLSTFFSRITGENDERVAGKPEVVVLCFIADYKSHVWASGW